MKVASLLVSCIIIGAVLVGIAYLAGFVIGKLNGGNKKND